MMKNGVRLQLRQAHTVSHVTRNRRRNGRHGKGVIVKYKGLIAASLIVVAMGCGGSPVEDDPVVVDLMEKTVYNAARSGDLDEARGYILGFQWDPQRPEGGTGSLPIHAAVEGGNPDIVRLMVQNGADPNAVDLHGNTPLQIAEKKGNAAMIEVLKGMGAIE